MVFVLDKTSGPWKIVDKEKGISIVKDSGPEGMSFDIELRGKKLNLVYQDHMGGGLKGDEYYWVIRQLHGPATIQEERHLIEAALKEAIVLYTQTGFQGKKMKTSVDFSAAVYSVPQQWWIPRP
jgi:hypothetical protein